MRPWEIRAKLASGSSIPAERVPGVTVTVPAAAVEGSSKKPAGRPSRFRSSVRDSPARRVPQSTTQARPRSSRGRRSSASTWVLPPHTGSCFTFMFTRVRVGTS